MGWIDVAIPGGIGLLLLIAPQWLSKSSGDPTTDTRKATKFRRYGALLLVVATVYLGIKLAAAGVAPKAEPEADWVQLTSAEARFTAWFPREPKHTLPSGPLIHHYSAETRGGAVAFLVRCTLQADTSIPLDDLLATTREVMRSRNATVAPVTMCGLPAREMNHEYLYDGVWTLSRQRILYAGDTMYQLIVVGDAKGPGIPEEDANRFFSGFQLLTP